MVSEMPSVHRMGSLNMDMKTARTFSLAITITTVLNKLGLQSTRLMTVVRQKIVRFYGHVRRHDSLQRIITEGMVNGKRG